MYKKTYKIYKKKKLKEILAKISSNLKLWDPITNSRNTVYIVGCCMLRPFSHPVACCYVLLGVVEQSLKPVKLLEAFECENGRNNS